MTKNAAMTACPRDCYDTYSLRVTVEDGKITRIEGDPEPYHVGGSPGHRGRPRLQLGNDQGEAFTGLAHYSNLIARAGCQGFQQKRSFRSPTANARKASWRSSGRPSRRILWRRCSSSRRCHEPRSASLGYVFDYLQDYTSHSL